MARLRFETVLLMAAIILSVAVAPDGAQARHGQIRGCTLDLTTGDGLTDPGAPGPFSTVRADYNLGDSAANLKAFNDPVELRAEVTYPAELECGPFPIVFMMHGGHATCIDQGGETGAWDWPCEPVDMEPEAYCGPVSLEFCDPSDPTLPNYRGYRYLADLLASHGIVAVSISANGVNAADVINEDARAELFQRHFGLWLEYSTLGSADFGATFVGKIDLGRTGLLGHSRGGAGAARTIDVMGRSDDPFNNFGTKAPVQIQAIFLVAPTPGLTEETEIVTDTALAVLFPYCDGDQDDLPGSIYYDASRYIDLDDTGPKYSFEVRGANHNNYNTLWDPETTNIETVDDWVNAWGASSPWCQPLAVEPMSGRLTSAQAQGTLKASAGAFFRFHLKNQRAMLPFLRAEIPPPPSAMTDDLSVAYHPKSEVERLDLNRIMTEDETLVANTLGGAVANSEFATFEFCEGTNPANGCLTAEGGGPNSGQVPHAYKGHGSVNQLHLVWDTASARFSNDLPEAFQNISGYKALQFRAFVDPSDSHNPLDQPQNLSVELYDGAGLMSSVAVADYSSALFYPPSVDLYAASSTTIPRAILNTVRVPLTAFNNVFLTDIESIHLVFDQNPNGAINIADMALADEADNQTPVVGCSVTETELGNNGEKLVNVGLISNIDDEDVLLTSQIAVFSDEDDTDSDNKQTSPDAKDLAPGTLRLRSERDKHGDGRAYLIVATAADSEGALGHSCCTVTVPNGNQAQDLLDVAAEADAMLASCTAFAASAVGLGAVPEGYFVVGDGPVIGSDQ